MKLNELRTAVKEAGIRPVDTAHVAEVGAFLSDRDKLRVTYLAEDFDLNFDLERWDYEAK